MEVLWEPRAPRGAQRLQAMEGGAMNRFFFGRWGAYLAMELGVVTALVVAVTGGDLFQTRPAGLPESPFSIHATFVKGCSCPGPCAGELTGAVTGCKAVGAILVHSGLYKNADLAGAKIAYAVQRGQWVKIFVDGRDRDQKAAAEAFARDALKDLGPVRWVQPGEIDITGQGGDYLVTVNNGHVLQMVTEPVIGGDGRTPIMHTNTKDPLNPTLCQGKTSRAAYNDGEEAFTLEGSNAYFDENMLATGRM